MDCCGSNTKDQTANDETLPPAPKDANKTSDARSQTDGLTSSQIGRPQGCEIASGSAKRWKKNFVDFIVRFNHLIFFNN